MDKYYLYQGFQIFLKFTQNKPVMLEVYERSVT